MHLVSLMKLLCQNHLKKKVLSLKIKIKFINFTQLKRINFLKKNLFKFKKNMSLNIFVKYLNFINKMAESEQ